MTESEIREQLKRILRSDIFSRSSTSIKLLEYLTNETLKGENPKQYTIGVDVFHQTADDPSSSNIRVLVLKLRKKLDEFYKYEGKHDHIIFTIPKGNYLIRFKDKKKFFVKKPSRSVMFAAIIIALLIVTSVTFLFLGQSNYHKVGKTAFWHDLIANNKETVVVAGNFYVFGTYLRNIERDWYIRDPRVNSEEQLLKFMEKTDSLNSVNYEVSIEATYMPRDALFSMPYLIPLFYENNVTYEIILSTNFNWEVYYNSNIIYIGAFKNLKFLNLLLEKLDIGYNNENASILIKEANDPDKYKSYIDGQANIDYTLVAKIPGPNNNVIYLFVSDNDIGCIESVKQFTNRDSLKVFKKNILKDEHFFKAIYKAEGIARTGITFDMIDFQPITDSTLNNFWHY